MNRDTPSHIDGSSYRDKSDFYRRLNENYDNIVQINSGGGGIIYSGIHTRLGQKRLRDKLKLYLGSLNRSEDGYAHIPLSRTALSEFLYADRSAVSRELSRMKAEGMIELYRNHVRIIEKNFHQEPACCRGN